jgi:hypothetical protein
MSLKQTMPQSLFEQDTELAKLIDVLDDGLKTHQDGIERLYDTFDLLRMDDTTAERWLKAFGWKWRWPDNRRLLLKSLLNIYRWRGTREGIEKTVNIIYGVSISVKELWPFFYGLGRNIPDEDKNKAMIYLAPDLWKWVTAIEAVIVFMKPVHAVVEAVGIPDRMLLLNQAGALVTVTQDLSWQETKTWKVFTGPRFNAAGAVEAVTEDTSWSETITFKTFIGPRLNGPSLKLNGTGRANEGPTSTQQQVIQHPGSRTYKRFVAPVAALNARGTVIEDVVDHGWDETITEHRFTGPRFNSPPTLTMTGQARLNAGPKTSEQVVVHHPVLEITVKNDGGTLLNRGPTETRQEIINHPDVRTYKKFNPEAGMVLNGKPVLGYMWKKELKEAV